jgi:hypothetical protein
MHASDLRGSIENPSKAVGRPLGANLEKTNFLRVEDAKSIVRPINVAGMVWGRAESSKITSGKHESWKHDQTPDFEVVFRIF